MNTLFVDAQTAVNSFKFVYSLEASVAFIKCADDQLTNLFVKETGIEPGTNVCIAISEHEMGSPIYTTYRKENNHIGRKLMIKLFVNNSWNPITIFWKSKSGRDYKLHDSDIDANDILFWFDKLDRDLYFKQLYPSAKLPFKTNDLSFELVLVRLNLECAISLKLKEDSYQDIEQIKSEIGEFINSYNLQSEKLDRKYGVVHNFKVLIAAEGEITCELDLGSAGMQFLKKFLTFLSKLDRFAMVKIE